MSVTASINSSVVIGGKTVAENRTLTGEGSIVRDPSVPAAKVGQLTTRTDNDTGVVTMASGHGFATSDKIDLYWDGGKRLGMDATVATNAVTLDGGTGDNLPTNLTAVTAMKPVEEVMPTLACDGIKCLSIGSPKRSHIVIADGSGDLLDKFLPNSDGGEFTWHSANGETNPMAGDTMTKVKLSHGETSAVIMPILILFD